MPVTYQQDFIQSRLNMLRTKYFYIHLLVNIKKYNELDVIYWKVSLYYHAFERNYSFKVDEARY